jgi:hypothetical protein
MLPPADILARDAQTAAALLLIRAFARSTSATGDRGIFQGSAFKSPARRELVDPQIDDKRPSDEVFILTVT